MIGYIVPRSEVRGVNGVVSRTQSNSADGLRPWGVGGLILGWRIRIHDLNHGSGRFRIEGFTGDDQSHIGR
jgi:hypothetical protein